MKPIMIDCKILCLKGEAPKQHDVDQMYKSLDEYANRKYKHLKEIKETQYWVNHIHMDDMIFQIVKEFK